MGYIQGRALHQEPAAVELGDEVLTLLDHPVTLPIRS